VFFTGPQSQDKCLTDAQGGGSAFTITFTVAEAEACTYTASFVAPMDQSTPAKFIGNTFKKGRVIPIKAHVYCSGTEITRRHGHNPIHQHDASRFPG
jgi:hypothetical protein